MAPQHRIRHRTERMFSLAVRRVTAPNIAGAFAVRCMTAMAKDPHAILGVQRGASSVEINTAYRRMVRR